MNYYIICKIAPPPRRLRVYYYFSTAAANVTSPVSECNQNITCANRRSFFKIVVGANRPFLYNCILSWARIATVVHLYITSYYFYITRTGANRHPLLLFRHSVYVEYYYYYCYTFLFCVCVCELLYYYIARTNWPVCSPQTVSYYTILYFKNHIICCCDLLYI